MITRDWARYAKALDMRLGGAKLDEIGNEFGVTRERARQMVDIAQRQLAFRVFKGLPRPQFYKQLGEADYANPNTETIRSGNGLDRQSRHAAE